MDLSWKHWVIVLNSDYGEDIHVLTVLLLVM